MFLHIALTRRGTAALADLNTPRPEICREARRGRPGPSRCPTVRWKLRRPGAVCSASARMPRSWRTARGALCRRPTTKARQQSCSDATSSSTSMVWAGQLHKHGLVRAVPQAWSDRLCTVTGAAVERWRADAAAAADGTIPNIKMMTLDVLAATSDGSDRFSLFPWRTIRQHSCTAVCWSAAILLEDSTQHRAVD